MKAGSPAQQAGYNTIADIGRERIRRVIAQIQSESGQEDHQPSVDAGQLSLLSDPQTGNSQQPSPSSQSEDLGFKCYRLDRSHFKEWAFYTGNDPAELQLHLDAMETPLAEGWTPEGLLAETLLLEGFPLDSRVRPLPAFTENSVLRVTSEACAHGLTVCLDEAIHPATVEALDLKPEDTFICLDGALSDEAKLRLTDRCNLKVI